MIHVSKQTIKKCCVVISKLFWPKANLYTISRKVYRKIIEIPFWKGRLEINIK